MPTRWRRQVSVSFKHSPESAATRCGPDARPSLGALHWMPSHDRGAARGADDAERTADIRGKVEPEAENLTEISMVR
jgi:hypothetical protein